MNTSQQRMCGKKRRHASFPNAIRALAETGKQHGDLSLVAYRCDHCGFFHVGHPPRAEQKRLKYTRLLDLIDKAVKS